MKTAVISLYESYPPVCGAAVVTYNFAKYLPGKKHLIQFSKDHLDHLTENDLNIHNFRLTSDYSFRKFMSVILQIPKITRTIKNIKPDIVVLEGASWTFYYLLLYSFIKLAKVRTRIIYHAHNVEYLLRKVKNNKFVALITRISEAQLMAKADICTAVSLEDRELFSQLYGVHPVILPNGVAYRTFENIEKNEVEKLRNKYGLTGNICLFMGLPDYLPNKKGIDFLLYDVFPDLIESDRNYKLAIIGGKIKEERDWIINPGVIPFAEVPVFIQACDICLAPIFVGSGTRLKILEYLASGKPVVSTTKGKEGLSLDDKKNIIIADDSFGFIDAVKYLYENPHISERIGYEGKKTIIANYSWNKIISDFMPRINLLLENRNVTP